MIITMTARYSADNYADAVDQATELWRAFIGDPDAILPWNANIKVELAQEVTESASGEKSVLRTTGDASLSVKLDIEPE